MELTKNQYWIVIFIGLIFLIINGILIFKVLFDNPLPLSCPVPIKEINRCDCVYNALGNKNLRYCICYPSSSFEINLSEVFNESAGNN